eukprot:jgi/Bigna1/89248/estExt_fgenesh1_pg.C_460035
MLGEKQQGWLKKKSKHFLGIWQKRYFVVNLDKAELEYFEKGNSEYIKTAKPNGSIQFTDIIAVEPETKSQSDFIVSIRTDTNYRSKERKFLLRAPNAESMHNWIRHLKNAIIGHKRSASCLPPGIERSPLKLGSSVRRTGSITSLSSGHGHTHKFARMNGKVPNNGKSSSGNSQTPFSAPITPLSSSNTRAFMGSGRQSTRDSVPKLKNTAQVLGLLGSKEGWLEKRGVGISSNVKEIGSAQVSKTEFFIVGPNRKLEINAPNEEISVLFHPTNSTSEIRDQWIGYFDRLIAHLDGRRVSFSGEKVNNVPSSIIVTTYDILLPKARSVTSQNSGDSGSRQPIEFPSHISVQLVAIQRFMSATLQADEWLLANPHPYGWETKPPGEFLQSLSDGVLIARFFQALEPYVLDERALNLPLPQACRQNRSERKRKDSIRKRSVLGYDGNMNGGPMKEESNLKPGENNERNRSPSPGIRKDRQSPTNHISSGSPFAMNRRPSENSIGTNTSNGELNEHEMSENLTLIIQSCRPIGLNVSLKPMHVLEADLNLDYAVKVIDFLWKLINRHVEKDLNVIRSKHLLELVIRQFKLPDPKDWEDVHLRRIKAISPSIVMKMLKAELIHRLDRMTLEKFRKRDEAFHLVVAIGGLLAAAKPKHQDPILKILSEVISSIDSATLAEEDRDDVESKEEKNGPLMLNNSIDKMETESSGLQSPDTELSKTKFMESVAGKADDGGGQKEKVKKEKRSAEDGLLLTFEQLGILQHAVVSMLDECDGLKEQEDVGMNLWCSFVFQRSVIPGQTPGIKEPYLSSDRLEILKQTPKRARDERILIEWINSLLESFMGAKDSTKKIASTSDKKNTKVSFAGMTKMLKASSSRTPTLSSTNELKSDSSVVKNKSLINRFIMEDGGLLLLKILDMLEPGSVDWEKIGFEPMTLFQRSFNYNSIVKVASLEPFMLQLNFIGGEDLGNGNRKLTLALLWQLMRYHLYTFLEQVHKVSVNRGGGLVLAIRDGETRFSDKHVLAWANEIIEEAYELRGEPEIPDGKFSLTSKCKIRSFKEDHLKDSIYFMLLIWAMKPLSIKWSFVAPGS